ncbi:molybdenum cofactor biosynthesis protein MoaE [Thermostilla marina]
MPTIELTHEKLEEQAVLDSVRSNLAGAIVVFVGTTRELTGDRRTVSLDYEAFEELAVSELNRLGCEAEKKWHLTGCRIVHRLGNVPVEESSIVIAASAPHRRNAFEAVAWLIDEIKKTVPIWKRERYADGTEEWVHPTRSEDAAS